jgi:hypothetical protein
MGRRIRNARSRPQANIGDKFVREMIGAPPKRIAKKCTEPHTKRKSYSTWSEANTVVSRLTDYDAYKATTVKQCGDCGHYFLQLADQ